MRDDAKEALGVVVDVRPEHHAVDDGEDAGVDADADGEGEDHDEGEQRIAADHAAAVADVFPEGGEEHRGVAALLVDLLLPGFGQESAGGDHSGGEHFRRALLSGGDGGVLLHGAKAAAPADRRRALPPRAGAFRPLREAFGAPSPPEQQERGEEREEGGEFAGCGEEQRRNGGEVDHAQRVAEQQQRDHLFTGKVGAGEGQLAPIAEDAFEAEEGDDCAERGDGEGAEPTQDRDRGGEAGQIHGGDAEGDDEALHCGQPGGAAFLVGGLEHPVGRQSDRQREQVAQGQDHEHGEPERRGDGHQAVHAFVV